MSIFVPWLRSRLFWLLVVLGALTFLVLRGPLQASAPGAGVIKLGASVSAARGQGQTESFSSLSRREGKAELEAASPEATLLLPQRNAAVVPGSEAFNARSWYVPPPAPPVRPAEVVPAAPSAPPLPFAYLGRIGLADGRALYQLLRGEVVLSVAIGETLDRQYHLQSVEGDNLVFEYLPLHVRQRLSMLSQ